MPRKKLNALSLVAFAAMLATVYLGFSPTTALVVLISAVVTIVLASISIRRIRSREQAGKGFAVIALIIGILSLLLTVYVITVVGFV